MYKKDFSEVMKLGIEHPDINSLISTETKTLALRYIHNDSHFIFCE